MTPREMLEDMIITAWDEFHQIQKAEEEDDYSDAMLSMERTEAQGRLDAYTHLYKLTYDLSFAIADKEAGK